MMLMLHIQLIVDSENMFFFYILHNEQQWVSQWDITAGCDLYEFGSINTSNASFSYKHFDQTF